MNLILKLALQYLESHPERVMELADSGVSALVAYFQKLAAEHAANTPAKS